jgi:hypothetical protein
VIVVDAGVAVVVEIGMRCELEGRNWCRDHSLAHVRLDAKLFGCPAREWRRLANRLEPLTASTARTTIVAAHD